MRKVLEIQVSLYDTSTPKLLTTMTDLAVLLVERRQLKESEEVQRPAEVASELDAGVPSESLKLKDAVKLQPEVMEAKGEDPRAKYRSSVKATNTPYPACSTWH
jgi:hypothetical protein